MPDILPPPAGSQSIHRTLFGNRIIDYFSIIFNSSISSTANLSSVDSLLLFKTASNSLAFKLLTVSLYLFISGVIFIFYDRRHHNDDVCILLPYILPLSNVVSITALLPLSISIFSTGTTKYIYTHVIKVIQIIIMIKTI